MYDIFSLPDCHFPPGFIWGSSTAAHQIEGNNIHSQWWDNEQQGKTKERSGAACNSYVQWRDDNQLLSDLGHQAYRMSIEWSRIEPNQGEFNDEALDHYKVLIDDLKSRGIKVFLTLWHWTHPLWFEQMGGFTKRENVVHFERFTRHVAKALADRVDSWNILNEFNLRPTCVENYIVAHARAYRIIKEYSKAPVSSAHAFLCLEPWRRNDPFDRAMTDYTDMIQNEFFFHGIRTGEFIRPNRDMEYIPELKGSCDYWAINSYTRHFVDARKEGMCTCNRFEHKQLRFTGEPFYLEEFYPEGFIYNLERLKDLPVVITENGLSTNDDKFRIVYIALHLSALHEAMRRGVDLRGYLYWSLLDNYEWGSYKPRFGLVEVDRASGNFERTPKPSALFFKDVIEANALTQDIIRRHISELPTLRTPAPRETPLPAFAPVPDIGAW